MVIEVTDEAGDSAFEVDVVFPQRIVRVDEQGLRGGWIQAGHLSTSSHGSRKVRLIASECNGRRVHQGVVKVGSSGSKGWKEKLGEDILQVLYRY